MSFFPEDVICAYYNFICKKDKSFYNDNHQKNYSSNLYSKQKGTILMVPGLLAVPLNNISRQILPFYFVFYQQNVTYP